MKTAMKKLFSLMLVAVLLVGVFPMAAFATETDENIAPADVDGMLPGAEDQGFEIYDPESDVAPVEETNDEIATTDVGGMLPNREDQPFQIPEGPTNGGNQGGPSWPDKPVRPDGPTQEGTPNAPTSLTVKFYIDNVLAETVTHNASTDVLNLIQTCCTVDDGEELHYSGARVDDTPYDLGDIVELGETVHIYLYREPAAVEPTPDTDAKSCSQCGAKVRDGMCTRCYLDEADCTCCAECRGTIYEHERNCPEYERESTRGKVDLILDYNYKGAKDTTMKVERDAKIIDLIASIPAPTRDGHLFSHWTMDEAGEDLIDDECVTDKGTKIYAQWDDDLAVGGRLTVRVNWNYDRKMGESMTNIKKGTKMGDVLDYVEEPTRWRHKFVGWYWDRDCKDPVENGDRVYNNCTIYAKWEYRKTNNEIMLKVYLNGNTKSVAKLIDMYEYSKDGKITLSEVKDAVKQHYTAKDSDGLDFDGLYEAAGWSEYVSQHRHYRGSKNVYINRDDDTTIYVMVHNAKVRTSSSSGTADSSNPKTGDMIFTSVTVMGASASCLAVLFYLNKKRAI